MKKRDMITTFLALVSLGFMGCQTPTSSVFKSKLPPLTDGFHWEVFDEIEVAIPSPDGWYRAVSRGNGTYTGSISLEDFKTDGLFKTGFTIQVIADVKQRTGQPASMLAIAMGQ